MSLPSAFTGGPTGLGTSAAAIAVTRPASATTVADGAYPDLDGPGPVRVDERLGEEVNERLVAWAEEVGIYADQLDHFRASRFGHLAMLVHPDTDDVEQLLLAARWMAALFAVDDYYVDDPEAGAVPEKVGPRLTLALSALERPQLVGKHAEELEDDLGADPVLVAIRRSLEEVARHATPAQVARIRHETVTMFVTMNAEAAWGYVGELPPVRQFLAARQPLSFLPCMSVIDVVGGYEVPADVYSSAAVRRATGLAASVTVVANDLYSLAKERTSSAGDFNLPTLIAAEERCSLQEAIRITIGIHNELIEAFEQTRRNLGRVPSPSLQRFLLGLRAWIGGSREWHESSTRYSTAERGRHD